MKSSEVGSASAVVSMDILTIFSARALVTDETETPAAGFHNLRRLHLEAAGKV